MKRCNPGGVCAAILLAVGSSALAGPPPASVKMSGEYVEARTGSVYTGACHAMSEATTTAREALMAWDIKAGEVDGVKIDGLRVVAAVAADANLANADADKRSVIYVDSRATQAQRDAVIRAIQSRYATELGKIAAVKVAPITFQKNDLEYTVRVPDVAYLKTTRYACDHCIMPHAVWYEPLVPLKSSIVALSAANEFKGVSELSIRWNRASENSSFVGEFAF